MEQMPSTQVEDEEEIVIDYPAPGIPEFSFLVDSENHLHLYVFCVD